ncbi:MAG: MCP four helix bundle domain-containing protein [Flagellimonas sp.]
MGTKLSLKQRILVGFVLAMAFLLVIGANLMDRRQFSTIQKSIASIHDDRVIVQDYIYQLRNLLHAQELKVLNRGSIEKNDVGDRAVLLLEDFEKTELTREEANFLKRLREQFSKLESYQLANMSNIDQEESKSTVLNHMYKTKETLDALEVIQIEESGHLTQLSEKTLTVNIMLSNLEIGFMIIIGVSILILVFQPIRTLYPMH